MNQDGKADGAWWRALTAAATAALGFSSQAQVSNDEPAFGIRQLHYTDSQPGQERVSVKGWAIDATIPLTDQWVFEGYGVVDAITGASPSYYTAPSSFKSLVDKREAFDVRISHLESRTRLTAGIARSAEADYVSASHSLTYAISSDDQNQTWTLGVSHTGDRINPVTRVVRDQRKRLLESLLGWTQVLSPRDLLQVQWTHARGEGYFSDPYKIFDKRPPYRRQDALSVRWNHHLPSKDATFRSAARLYGDSFGVVSATLSVEWAQQIGPWTLTPALRSYAQTSAHFFSPPDPLRPDTPRLPNGYVFGQSLISMDQRLAGFGARTLGFRVDRQLSGGHSVMLKVEHYKQRTRWDWLGDGGSALRDFRSTAVQIGYDFRWSR